MIELKITLDDPEKRIGNESVTHLMQGVAIEVHSRKVIAPGIIGPDIGGIIYYAGRQVGEWRLTQTFSRDTVGA